MTPRIIPLALFLSAVAATANVAPSPVVVSAAMRPGTTLMDVVFRVDDPDDATVKTRALAFVDGERSFAKVIKPVTFVEGTAAKIGNAIASNTNHTLTWDVAADWNTDVGQLKFEVLAMDGRGLLPIDWITIPAAGGKPALTISKDAPTDAAVLDALFWRYADGDTGLLIENGVLRGNDASGVFAGIRLVDGNTVQTYAAPFVFKRMNLAVANETAGEIDYANITARAGLLNPNDWHATNRPYDGLSVVCAWGDFQSPVSKGVAGIAAILPNGIVLKNDGNLIRVGDPHPLAGFKDVTSVSGYAPPWFSAAVSGGKVVAWGTDNAAGELNVPQGLSGVVAVATGVYHGLALKNDGTVIAWGDNIAGQCDVPSGLSSVARIVASDNSGYAIKSDGTVAVWGQASGTVNVAGLSGVTKIAAASYSALALKTDGTVVGLGDQSLPSIRDIPPGLIGITEIAIVGGTGFAVTSTGSVVGWGTGYWNILQIPSGLKGVKSVACAEGRCYALKAKAL